MKNWFFWLLVFLAHCSGSSFALTVDANFTSASTIPVTAASYTATGNTVNLTLGFAPATGTNLTIVKNTGIEFIQGTFSNLAHGQQVNLSYGGQSYPFVANYYGGSGNDLVLHWKSNGIANIGISTLIGNEINSLIYHKTVVMVSEGYDYGLALCSDGTVVAWGDNTYGQLGNNSTKSSSTPVLVDQTGVLSGKTVVAVSAGWSSVALCSDGTVAIWGSGYLTPRLVNNTAVLNQKIVVAVSTGDNHTLALCSDGTLVAWGSNSNGQLGNKSTTGSGYNNPVLVNQTGVLSGKTVVAISAADSVSNALCSDGTVAAWGYGSTGQMGNNSTILSNTSPVLVDQTGVLSGRTVVAVSAGDGHTLALCSDGTVAAWGYNASGELGNNSTSKSSVPVMVNQSGVLSGKTVVAQGYLILNC